MYIVQCTSTIQYTLNIIVTHDSNDSRTEDLAQTEDQTY